MVSRMSQLASEQKICADRRIKTLSWLTQKHRRQNTVKLNDIAAKL